MSGARHRRKGDRVERDVVQARVVLTNAPELAKNVMEGAKSLDEANEMVRQRLNEASSDEAKLRIREREPDVADLVVEGKITLAAAVAEVAERQRQETEARDHARRSAAIIANEMTGHIANIMAGIQLGEKKLIDREKINKLIANLKTMTAAAE